MPTSKQIYKALKMENETPVPKTYTEKQLVDFGNYLLSRKRFDSIRHGVNIIDIGWAGNDELDERLRVVHQEDIDNALGESK